MAPRKVAATSAEARYRLVDASQCPKDLCTRGPMVSTIEAPHAVAVFATPTTSARAIRIAVTGSTLLLRLAENP
jgi:hypothetical protein